MSAMRVLLCLFLAASTASAVELKTLKGESIKGEVVSLTAKEIVIASDGKKVTTSLDQVLNITFSDEYTKFGADDKYILVELTDGTQLKCAKVGLKGKEATLQTLQDQKITLPMTRLSWILNDAHDPKNVQAFKERVLGKRKARDILAIKVDDVVNPVEGTIGDADEKGETIEFLQRRVRDGKEELTKREVELSRPLALFWNQAGAASALKPVVCRMYDLHRNLLYVSELKQEGDGYTVVTSAGATLKYTNKQVAKLDYSTGKLAYLSDLEPAELKQPNALQLFGKLLSRDQNLDGNPIRLAGTEYKHGLAIHSTTEVEYNLDGEYRELKGVVGIDDDVGGGDAPVVFKVYGDDVQMLKWTVTRQDKERVRNLALTIKDVRKLKIVVTTEHPIDALDTHLTVAEARVQK
jgi:hypothetical protein